MKSGLFTLDWGSIADAVGMAVFTALLASAFAAVTAPGFDVFAVHWVAAGKSIVNLSIIVGVSTLAKDFLSTNTGSFLGITPDNKTNA